MVLEEALEIEIITLAVMLALILAQVAAEVRNQAVIIVMAVRV